jgi:hypothetical protein
MGEWEQGEEGKRDGKISVVRRKERRLGCVSANRERTRVER